MLKNIMNGCHMKRRGYYLISFFISNTISLLKNKLGVAQRKEIVYERPKIIEECVALTKKQTSSELKAFSEVEKQLCLRALEKCLRVTIRSFMLI